MKHNNMVARHRETEPLFSFMKFDYYDSDKKIEEVR